MEDEMIFDDDDFGFDEDIQQEELVEQTIEEPTEESDFTTEVLRLKGIDDPSKIKFEDESGVVIERSWDSLTREEQLNILADSIEVEKDTLTDVEKQLLESFRSSGMSIEDFTNQGQHEVQPSYRIDELTDDEVYALNLLDTIGQDNITDEEITQEIDKAKQNETLFKKTVDSIRNKYIQLQKDEEEQYAQQQAAQQQAAYQQFATSIQNEISNLNSFAGQDLELSNEDVEALSKFVLELDDNGVSRLGAALQDPKTLTEVAFWILNKEAIIEELTKQMQDSYKRGYETPKNNITKVVKKEPQVKNEESVFDMDDDW